MNHVYVAAQRRQGAATLPPDFPHGVGRPWRVKEACVEWVRVVAAGGRKHETVACHLRARGEDQIIDGVALCPGLPYQCAGGGRDRGRLGHSVHRRRVHGRARTPSPGLPVPADGATWHRRHDAA
jgi:hypothetical protein